MKYLTETDQIRRSHFASTACTTFWLSFAIPLLCTTEASAQVLHYSIPAGPIEKALASYSTANGLQIVYRGDVPLSKQSSGVTGDVTKEIALDKILAGSGITYRFVDARRVELSSGLKASRIGSNDDDGTELKTIVITSANSPYSSPDATSSLSQDDLILKNGGDLNSSLRGQPGVFTLQPADQPGISTNIRGMEGYGRVNTMIDGVPQNFRNVSGHGSSGGNLTYVDPNLLAGVDVERGAVSGAHGSGTLAGAVNMRTLELDDVLLPGKDWGGMTRLTAGSNGSNYATLYAGGARHDLGEDGSIGIVGAFSQSDFQRYKNGDGDIVGQFNTENRPKSGLAKFSLEPDQDQKIEIGGRWYQNEFVNSSYIWDVKNSTYTADYSLSPAGNDLVDLNIHGFLNRTELSYPLDSGGSYRGRNSRDITTGVSVDNTSRIDLGDDVSLKLFYGGSWQKDDYTVNALKGGNPPGSLSKYGVFSETTLDWNMFRLTGGLRYDHWGLNGYQAPITAGMGSCPAGGPNCGGTNVETSGGRWSPRVTLSAKPLPWLQPYATYSETFRPPTVQETFFSLIPIGAGLGSGVANNINLRPEIRKGWDFGTNLSFNGVLSSDDNVNVKIGYFSNKIDDFIVNDFVDVPGRGDTAMWVNRPGTTHMDGVEFQASYDLGYLYMNASYTASSTKQPIGQAAGWGNGLYGESPSHYGSFDIGTRLLENRLTVGATVNYTGSSVEGYGDLFGAGAEYRKLPSYTLFDIYASFKANGNMQVFATVKNVFNKSYTPADSYESSYSNTGKGTTAIAGLTLRF
ncbi:TonB-dependent receptor [Aliirhizobium smilacinae]|uniref:TonB-dependent receptor n=1 Tax=Aliirhizobium smilacinae TaxID=1395944 RepID=A0A5C4X7U5_9HYPH|nr:TonB-dependent receptor [Rhizobium smilacinae]TNM59533.1 TonB-dependent receptor [Rhizobium smilacinae]